MICAWPIRYSGYIKRKKEHDFNVTAFNVVQQATGGNQEPDNGKNPAAVILGRLGGLKGGKARAKKLSAKQRSEIAKKAAKMRWENHS